MYKLRIMVSCPSGAGVSLLMKSNIKKVLSKMNIDYDVIDHYSLSEGKSKIKNYHVIFCPRRFEDVFLEAKRNGVEVIGLNNVLSLDEAYKKLSDIINKR